MPPGQWPSPRSCGSASASDVDVIWADDGIAFRFPDADDAPGSRGAHPRSGRGAPLVEEHLADTALFAARFREAAGTGSAAPPPPAGGRTRSGCSDAGPPTSWRGPAVRDLPDHPRGLPGDAGRRLRPRLARTGPDRHQIAQASGSSRSRPPRPLRSPRLCSSPSSPPSSTRPTLPSPSAGPPP